MKQENTITAFIQLGNLFRALGSNEVWKDYSIGVTENEYLELNQLIAKEKFLNPWFVEDEVRNALVSLSTMLESETLSSFSARYHTAKNPKTVLLVMAGNIPLVGFHDFMCVLLSGNKALCKCSSDDNRLLPAFAKILIDWNPELEKSIQFSVGKATNFDAVIATGSNNSALYFEQYFGKYPHIFRKNRTSIAVLTGLETSEQLTQLGSDIFGFFGLGCRNVSKLLIHESFDLNRFFECIVGFGECVNHHKYANNYDYNRTIYLMNSIPFLDNNFCLLKEDEGLHAPLAVIYYERYTNEEQVINYCEMHSEEIQAVVGLNSIPFGAAQHPNIDDFADNVDTMNWLTSW